MGRSAWHGLHEAHRASLGHRPATVWIAAVAQWAFALAAIACCLAAFGLAPDLGPALAVLTGLTLAHAIPITPGGVGVNQAGAMLPLTVLYGVPPETALAAGVAVAAAESAVSLLAGTPCMLWEAQRCRRPQAPVGPATFVRPRNDSGAPTAPPSTPSVRTPPYSPAGASGSKW